MAYPVPSPHSFFVIRKDQEIKGIVKNANNVIHENKLSILNKKDELELADTQKLLHLFHKKLARECKNQLKLIVQRNFRGQYIYQRSPYLRISHPSVSESYTQPHSDMWYGHSIHTIAIWIPLTKCGFFESLSLQDPVTNEFITPKLDIGDFIVFGGSIIHGTFFNLKNKLRKSLDYRFHPIDKPLASKKDDLFLC